MTYKMQKHVLLTAFLALPMLFMAMFLIYPAGRMIFYSFTNWDGVLPIYDYVGFDNFVRMLNEPLLWMSLKNNAVYALNGVVQNMAALFFAVILTGKLRGRNFYKTVSFLPYVLNITAVAYMFNFLFDYREGPINEWMRYLGMAPIRFLSDEHLVIFSLAGISLWKWLGYSMILYLGALQAIDQDMYEAAKVDGANPWQTFWKVTWPNIQVIVQLNLLLTISGALQAFTEPLIMTNGGPDKASYTFLFYIIQSYTVFNDYGYAAAMACSLIMITILLALVQRVLIRGTAR